jgi:DNA-binding SARP family transcriptional activator
MCDALVAETDAGLRLHPALLCDVGRDACADDADFTAPLLGGMGGEDDRDDCAQDWLDEARRQWAARRADVLGGLAAQQEASGAVAAALASTEQLLAIEPRLEHAWRRLMRLHAVPK